MRQMIMCVCGCMPCAYSGLLGLKHFCTATPGLFAYNTNTHIHASHMHPNRCEIVNRWRTNLYVSAKPLRIIESKKREGGERKEQETKRGRRRRLSICAFGGSPSEKITLLVCIYIFISMVWPSYAIYGSIYLYRCNSSIPK